MATEGKWTIEREKRGSATVYLAFFLKPDGYQARGSMREFAYRRDAEVYIAEQVANTRRSIEQGRMIAEVGAMFGRTF